MKIKSNKGAVLIREEDREAHFSDCELYRYLLEIVWDSQGRLIQVIGLNPSTADELRDDRTVAKLKRLAKRLGYGGLLMTNIFAFRATDPRVMRRHASPIGVENDSMLLATAKRAGLVLAAWGTDGEHLGRGAEVRSMIDGLHCLKVTKGGHHYHPLYVKDKCDPFLWEHKQ